MKKGRKLYACSSIVNISCVFDFLTLSFVIRNSLGSSSPSLSSKPSTIIPQALPQPHAWTIPSPENPALNHSPPPWGLALRAVKPRGNFPTHGGPSALNPIIPDQVVFTLPSPQPSLSSLSGLPSGPQFSSPKYTGRAPAR